MTMVFLRADFISIHYAYIILCSLLAFVIIYPFENLRAIDAFFFGVSANTESGLNTVDVKDLVTFQQFVLYIFPILTNIGFINIIVVVVRLHYFEKRLQSVHNDQNLQSTNRKPSWLNAIRHGRAESSTPSTGSSVSHIPLDNVKPHDSSTPAVVEDHRKGPNTNARALTTHEKRRVTWAEDVDGQASLSPLKNHSDRYKQDLEDVTHDVENQASMETDTTTDWLNLRRRSSVTSVSSQRNSLACESLPQLSHHATLGRNSSFGNLTKKDREVLGGLEYQSLKLLLKIVIGYFLGLHLFGALCLAPWITNAPLRYREYLAAQGQGQVWWAFYSAQTMISNLGFTLTPDSMIHFRDATWPMLVMTFLAYAGNTCYPILLRVVIWTMHKFTRQHSSTRQSLGYLLEHPRRCYTLLFPSNVTWILFGILFVLNFLDALFIIVLDLNSEEVTALPLGPRVLAALFQSASSRHTGTSTFNLANVNPAVQFSLLIMMYIAVFPIAISVRVSNTYEERALGKYAIEDDPADNLAPSKYLAHHMRNQLSFDLWYIFLGTFLICIAEAAPIRDTSNTAFNVFAVLFEVTSAYGNVGLSLGTNATLTSLSGDFHTFSKLVICAMMLRGRHRGLPYALDHAVMLPGDERNTSGVEYGDDEDAS